MKLLKMFLVASFLILPLAAWAVDLDIKKFKVSKIAFLSKGPGPINLSLVVENNGSDEGNALATISGVQGQNLVYYSTMEVTDLTGPGFMKYQFPVYIPTETGDIFWEAYIDDDDPDKDLTVAVTVVDH